MRDDFERVIIERPRHGSRGRNLKTRWSAKRFDSEGDYSLPAVTSSKVDWKGFNDHLSPLQRYLEKQVGRPWWKVEGELRAGMDFSTIIGRHLWSHAERMVEREVRMSPDGHAYTLRGYPVRGLFVHPRSGLILRQRPWKRDPSAERRKRIADATKVRLDANVTAEKVKDLWYLFTDEHRTEVAAETRWLPNGVSYRVRVSRPVIRKKQASKEELQLIRAALERSL